MARSTDSAKALDAAIKIAEDQGFIVHRKGTRIHVARADHPEIGTQVSTNIGSGRALHNTLASLRRLGVDLGDHGNLHAPTDADTISVRGVTVVNKAWREMTTEERAYEVWQVLLKWGKDAESRTRFMHGADYVFSTKKINHAIVLLYPDMPYDPDEDTQDPQGKGIYDYLKGNKIVIGQRGMIAIRTEWSKVEVTAKTKPRKKAAAVETVVSQETTVETIETDDTYEDDGHLIVFLDANAKCEQCGHTANMHNRALAPCKAKGCIGGPNRQPCPLFVPDPDLTCPLCAADDTVQVCTSRQALKEHMLRAHGNLTVHPSVSRDAIIALIGEETFAVLESAEDRVAHANAAARQTATTVETVVETTTTSEVEIVAGDDDALADIDVALALLREQIERLVNVPPIADDNGAALLLEEVKKAYRELPPLAAYQTVSSLLNL